MYSSDISYGNETETWREIYNRSATDILIKLKRQFSEAKKEIEKKDNAVSNKTWG